jgi:FkbM family methyltransferase
VMPVQPTSGGVTSGVLTRSSQLVRRLARRRLARGTFALGENRVLTTNPDGLCIYLDAFDTSLTPMILTRRTYEPGTTRLLSRIVRPGSRVVEVGANIGWHTLIAAERVGPSGMVKAFEPNPRMFDILHTNVFVNALWDRCFVDQRAVGRSAGQAVLRVPGTYTGGANLRDFDAGALAWMHQDETEVTVSVTTLDDALADNLHYDVLKIDVEGFEPEVVAGGESFFAANPDLKMIMEFTPSQHGEAMVRWAADQGKQLHTIDRFGRTHRVSDPLTLMEHLSLDVFIVR